MTQCTNSVSTVIYIQQHAMHLSVQRSIDQLIVMFIQSATSGKQVRAWIAQSNSITLKYFLDHSCVWCTVDVCTVIKFVFIGTKCVYSVYIVKRGKYSLEKLFIKILNQIKTARTFSFSTLSNRSVWTRNSIMLHEFFFLLIRTLTAQFF